ncbi:MAG: hypothetical protein J0I41_22715 [Filimonas sp.]|nr:hypothetical protein [Filimonas sp.]
MVYLRQILKENRARLLESGNIELAAYLHLHCAKDLATHSFDLSPEEQVALLGYKGEQDPVRVMAVVTKPAFKGISATSNIFKFTGLYLAAKNEPQLKQLLQAKFMEGDLKQKYFLARMEPSLHNDLVTASTQINHDPAAALVRSVLQKVAVPQSDLNAAIVAVVAGDIDVQLQLLLEDLERTLLETHYVNKSAEEVIRTVLNNFSNAVQKVTKNRRKGHDNFLIRDEYDVQDLLYVILKSHFPSLRDEDAIPKVGGKSTKIDLILRAEGILIEAKMIKAGDSNEVNFIEELKVDFESYHECKWLKKLFCFVYDPERKTRDLSNFKDLDGERVKAGHKFNVEVIVAS